MGLAVTVGISLAAVVLLLVARRRGVAKELVVLLPYLVLLFKDLSRDPRVPRSSKALLIVGAVWFASPIDLIPESIPVLGPLDDAVVAALILRHLLRTTGPDVVTEHWRGDPATLARLLGLSGVRHDGDTWSQDL